MAGSSNTSSDDRHEEPLSFHFDESDFIPTDNASSPEQLNQQTHEVIGRNDVSTDSIMEVKMGQFTVLDNDIAMVYAIDKYSAEAGLPTNGTLNIRKVSGTRVFIDVAGVKGGRDSAFIVSSAMT